MSTPFEIVIPSRMRASNVLGMRAMLPQARWCVEESEADAYLMAGVPEELLWCHPELYGMGAIRRWILENTDTPAVVMIDDDLRCVWSMVGRKKRRMGEPEAIASIIANTVTISSDLGVECFGWNLSPKPLWFKPHDPLDLSPKLSSSWGVIGRRHLPDPAIIGHEDADIVLQYLRSTRIVYADTRGCFDHGTIWSGSGGLQGRRTSDNERSDRTLIRRRWGPYLDLESPNSRGVTSYSVKVQRRSPVASHR